MEEAGVITRSKTQPDRPATSMVSQASQSPLQTRGKKRQRPTEQSEPDSPTQTQKQCTFRSNVIGTVGLLSKLNLNNAHLELLKQTPFWMLIDAIRKGKLAEKACMKHDRPILSIIQNYDTNDSKFLIGGDLNKKKSDVAFAIRRGIQEARIGVTIAWAYVHCMEKIEEIKDYDWAQSIAETLNTSMHKFHDKPRDATGCVVALMVYEEELQETCQEAQVYGMTHPEVVDDNDMETISQMMQHTQSPQSPAVQRLDEIHLTEKQQTSPLVSTSSPEQQQAMFSQSQSQSGETMVPSTYQPLDFINFSQGIIKEHNQMEKFCDSLLEDNDQDKDTMKNELEKMEKERNAMKEKLQKMVTMSNTMMQAQEQHKFLIENTAVLEKDSDAMKNQLLEMEKERHSLEEKLQEMDSMSKVFKKDRDEMEKQMLEMGKERDSLKEMLQNADSMSNKIVQTFELKTAELEKQKHMMLQQFEIEKEKIKKDLMMQIESLKTEKGQLQKYLSTTEQKQKAIIVQKDAEICSLTNKLSIQPQKHLPVVETDSSLLTQGSEEAIHNITQTYTDEKIEQVVHEVTQLYSTAAEKSEGDNKDDNAKQRPRRQKMDDDYYYGSITKDGRKKEQIVLVESDEPQAETKKLDDKIPPLEKKANIVLSLLPDKCQETIRKFWELEEGCTHIWDCEFDDLRIYQEDVRFLLCDRELTSQTFIGGDQDAANRALDVVRSKILNTRTILIPIYCSSHYTLLELDTIDQEWKFYNSILVVAYIIRQKLMKKLIQSDLTKQQCLQMRADIVQAFVNDPKRSWTPKIYHNRMENPRLQKYYDDQELLEEKKKQA
ncbi:hypothetical protein RHSIM_RhsimUnG0169600 [Rhododendron simsii]|uniref:Uncharacterized protein n=1 Tax=Rhododendron simsii TaxID=118357 RepID=A0A834L4B4_RHOSS|nr:hypothetical protein RHSIM_RhsimUnG0169600 [Rhododendron simsii]